MVCKQRGPLVKECSKLCLTSRAEHRARATGLAGCRAFAGVDELLADFDAETLFCRTHPPRFAQRSRLRIPRREEGVRRAAVKAG